VPATYLLVLTLLAADPVAAAPAKVDRNTAPVAIAADIVADGGQADSNTFTFDPEHLKSDAKQGFEAFGVTSRGFHTGRRSLPEFVIKEDPSMAVNGGSAEFDGVKSLVKIGPVASHAPCFTAGSFTWEGFFFSPSTAQLKTDGAIGDRLISQFRDDNLGSTRLAIGLGRAKKDGPNSLCVSLVGSETRYLGSLPVSQDAWHHFALVYVAPSEAEAAKLKAAAGTAPANKPSGPEKVSNVGGKLTWYLDYKKCGEIVLDGKNERTTLAPLGKSPLTIGGRNLVPGKDGAEAKVDRGFRGLLDEVRISAQAVPVAEFLRSENKPPQRLVQAQIFPARQETDLARYFDRESAGGPKSVLPAPLETIDQETVGLAGLPTAFALGGYIEPRRGVHGVRTSYRQTLPAGRYRLFVRTQSDAMLALGDRVVIDARRVDDSALGSLPAGVRDYRYDFTSTGGEQEFRLAALIDYDGAATRGDVADTKPAGSATSAALSPVAKDEIIVGIARIDEETGRELDMRLLGAAGELALDPYSWRASRGRDFAHWMKSDEARRQASIKLREEFWQRRREWAKTEAEKWPAIAVPKSFSQREKVAVYSPTDEGRPAATSHTQKPLTPALSRRGEGVIETAAAPNPIDAFLAVKMAKLRVQPAPVVDDATFLRRATLDFAGRNPTWQEAQAFLADRSEDRRAKLVERLLASPDWADSWVGYWQDLLAENPSILKPTLNNSGPFRRWIHESFAANKPLDRFAAELMLMQGSDEQGGTAGFAIASGNALPMAMKGHVVAQAFLGIDMKCARCHDGPNVPFAQSDLFGLAAMLDEKPITVDLASTVVTPPGGRVPAVKSTLKVGDKVQPQWPLERMVPRAAAEAGVSLVELADRPRARLAAIVVAPTTPRFSDVAVNRIWQRYFGQGLVDPVDHWLELDEASHPDLLRYLSREFVVHGYDVKWLARVIANSDAYRREATGEATSYRDQRTFAAQLRRRCSAEQVVDSLYLAVGKSMNAEELNFDPNGTQGFLILPTPEKSWQFASLANERDRPALALPTNQMILDVLTTFGWRETRIDPWTRQDAEVNPLQPLMMANSAAVNQAIRLTEESAATEWCLEDGTPEQLVDRLFLATLSRPASDGERRLMAGVLAESFATRKTGKAKPKPIARVRAHVDWDKHLQGEASLELLEAAKQAQAGDPATVRLTTEFRTAVEDVLWTLVNSPEFVFVP